MIVGTDFLAFNAFSVKMVLEYKGVGRWRDYPYGECMYIILNSVAKSALARSVLFGAMPP